jgi:hypothetical protein
MPDQKPVVLPPLPKPLGTRLGTRGVFGIGNVLCEVDSHEYTTHQMAEYAKQAVLDDRERR